MNRKTAHHRFFGVNYRAPKRSNISTGIYVSIHIVSAVIAFKRFVLPITNPVANRTDFRGVGRVNNNQFHTANIRKVSYILNKNGKHEKEIIEIV